MSSLKLNEYDILIGRLSTILSELHYTSKYSLDNNTTFEIREIADNLNSVIEGIKKERAKLALLELKGN